MPPSMRSRAGSPAYPRPMASTPTRFEHHRWLGDKRKQVVYDLQDEAERPRDPFEDTFALGRWGTPYPRDPAVVGELRREGLIQREAPLPGHAFVCVPIPEVPPPEGVPVAVRAVPETEVGLAAPIYPVVPRVAPREREVAHLVVQVTCARERLRRLERITVCIVRDRGGRGGLASGGRAPGFRGRAWPSVAAGGHKRDALRYALFDREAGALDPAFLCPDAGA